MPKYKKKAATAPDRTTMPAADYQLYEMGNGWTVCDRSIPAPGTDYLIVAHISETGKPRIRTHKPTATSHEKRMDQFHLWNRHTTCRDFQGWLIQQVADLYAAGRVDLSHQNLHNPKPGAEVLECTPDWQPKT